MVKTHRMAVLTSDGATHMQALRTLVDGWPNSRYEIAVVVSSKDEALLDIPVPVVFHPIPRQNGAARTQCEAQLVSLLRERDVDLVVLVGFGRLLSAWFLDRFPQRVISLHPALLPGNGIDQRYTTKDGTQIPVFRGLHAVRQAIAAKVSVTGCTVHYVTPELDAGPVICIEEVPVHPGETEESLSRRLIATEPRLLVKALQLLVRARPSPCSACQLQACGPSSGNVSWETSCPSSVSGRAIRRS